MAQQPRFIPSQKLLIKEQVPQFVLENPQTNVSNSLEFLKKMTVVAVSRITSGRQLFPDGAFIEKQVEGHRVKILRGAEDFPDSKVMVDWLSFAFQLVSEHYLRKIYLVIQNNDSKTGERQTIEMYIFNFDYDEKKICYQLLMEGPSSRETDLKLPAEVTSSVTQLLRSIDAVITKLEPLPDCEFSLRLELKEDTPDQAFKSSALFKQTESLDMCFPSDATKWKLGKVKTKFTTFTVSTKSVLFESHEIPDSEEGEEDVFDPITPPEFSGSIFDLMSEN